MVGMVCRHRDGHMARQADGKEAIKPAESGLQKDNAAGACLQTASGRCRLKGVRWGRCAGTGQAGCGVCPEALWSIYWLAGSQVSFGTVCQAGHGLLETSSDGQPTCRLAAPVQHRLKLVYGKGVEAGRGICQTAVLQWEAACRQPQTRVKSIQRVLSTLCGKQEQARTDCALQ